MNQRYLPAFVLGLIILAGLVTFMVREGDSLWTQSLSEDEPMRTVTVAQVPVQVWVANTPDERRRGLSGYAELPENHGMLFVFDASDSYGIWMKDMHFPIDVLWLSAGGVVVDVKDNIAPETYPEVFGPRTSAQYVLELPAGFAEMHGVSVGDRVEL